MDQALEERLHVYEREGLASPAIVAFTRETLHWLEETARHPCTEESAGFFASHLMLALARIERGEELGDNWDASVHEQAEELKALQPWAESIRARAQKQLGLALPPQELDFIVIHLGSFMLHYNDPLLSHIAE